MPCQKAEVSCGFDAMVEAFNDAMVKSVHSCYSRLDFGDFDIKIKEACHFS